MYSRLRRADGPAGTCRRSDKFMIISGLLFTVCCSGFTNPSTEPGKGITYTDEKLKITLNAGMLTEDPGINRVARKYLEELEHKEFRINQRPVKLQFITDQPQSPSYITGRVMGRRQAQRVDALIFRSQYSFPGFSKGFPYSNARDAVYRYQIYRISALKSAKFFDGSGNAQHPVLNRYINGSPVHPQLYLLSHWHSYFQAQVHYDIVITENSFIEDRTGYANPAMVNSRVLLPAPGRAALEQTALLAGYDRNGFGVQTGQNFKKILEEGLIELIQADKPDESMSGRFEFLVSLAAFHSGRKKSACNRFKNSSYMKEVAKLPMQQRKLRLRPVRFMQDRCRSD